MGQLGRRPKGISRQPNTGNRSAKALLTQQFANPISLCEIRRSQGSGSSLRELSFERNFVFCDTV